MPESAICVFFNVCTSVLACFDVVASSSSSSLRVEKGWFWYGIGDFRHIGIRAEEHFLKRGRVEWRERGIPFFLRFKRVPTAAKLFSFNGCVWRGSNGALWRARLVAKRNLRQC